MSRFVFFGSRVSRVFSWSWQAARRFVSLWNGDLPCAPPPESLGKPSLWVIINETWYYSAHWPNFAPRLTHQGGFV